MRTLYRLLLRLYPARVRAEFAEEMLQVFECALEDARRNGVVEYAQFCVREAAGLLVNVVMEGKTMVKHRKLILQGGAAGLLIGVAAAGAWATRPYTSTAVLRANPPMIPDRFVSAQPSVELGRVVRSLMQAVTSRDNLIKIANSHQLYGSERDTMPPDDIVQRMRRAIEVVAAEMGAVRVSFSYADRKLAQQVTADLVSRMIAEYSRTRSQQAILTVRFVKDSAEKAALDWERSLVAVREAEASGKSLARARLDAEIARQRYESLSTKVAEAEMTAEMENRRQGQSLEILDPASLPAGWRPPILLSAIGGAFVGALLGWLISFVLATRPRRAVAEAH